MCTKKEIREVVREVLEEKEWFVAKAKCSLRTNKINTTIKLMQKDIKNIMKSQTDILKQLEKMEEKFANKWTEKWITAVTIIFALSALYLLFEKANLPH
jgi:hypothetical protein